MEGIKEKRLFLFKTANKSEFVFANSFETANAKFRKLISKPVSADVYEIKDKKVIGLETIVKSCEDLLNIIERCSDQNVNDLIICSVFDILEFIAKERVGECLHL